MILSLLAAMLLQAQNPPRSPELNAAEQVWIHCMLGQIGWLQRVEEGTPAEVASLAPQRCLELELRVRDLLTASLLPSRGQEAASTEANHWIARTRAEAEAILSRGLADARQMNGSPRP